MQTSEKTTVSRQQPGRLAKALLRMFMKHAYVVATEPLSERFRLLTLESAAFEGVAWVPGQKVQIAMGSAFVARTFTPIDWDAAAGRTRLLGYVHGGGPGSEWVSSVAAGDECDVFGPRASLAFPGNAEPIVVFGDETSFGLACSLLRAQPTRAPHCLFEVDDIEAARRVATRLGLRDAKLVRRTDDEAHLAELETALPSLAGAHAHFVLTGKAQSIQRLRRTLKGLGVASSHLSAKAYWAPGKTGLD
ncbi:siderophore-interacting protein [Trinickia caryophylli]|uniref:Siderophore-interacting FAD-binding domain-containing protein n=1 Tax=Trinickia caryophylli TaxID=28094 RepID=A0A1X7CIM1_TRICW|nr:siderophore-interacting protein [Trinickia caryophylli]PMS11520.1 siderophore-interacting protein [Trinickia caryophylli]TRX19929.1 siderophore-interacting protein [Trinickia caryophylli]WQE12735.1 siderophore-interacting protein [Trinickia caryophylli]SME97300.1 Siderophore-interacting FAD-binding domain-containing protein [Trinickia caryophylli]GLU30442.1 hypothetical protein Busp01_02840 [Trinickia caryophylli]